MWNDKPFEVQEKDLKSFNEGIKTIRKYILQLEEKVEPVRGEWIEKESILCKYFSCSHCGGYNEYRTNFCGYCGAYMRGKKND